MVVSSLLYVISLLATFAGMGIAADVKTVAAKASAFPSTSKQRQLFRQWLERNRGSECSQRKPCASGNAGIEPVRDGRPGCQGQLRAHHLLQAERQVLARVISGALWCHHQRSTRQAPTHSSLLVIFVRSASDGRWMAQASADLALRPDMGKPDSTLSGPTKAQANQLVMTPDAAVQAVVTASNADLQAGTASTLLPDPSWYGGEAAWLQSIASENGGFTTQSSLSAYTPAMFFANPLAQSCQFSRSPASPTVKREGEGYWLNTDFFPGPAAARSKMTPGSAPSQ